MNAKEALKLLKSTGTLDPDFSGAFVLRAADINSRVAGAAETLTERCLNELSSGTAPLLPPHQAIPVLP